MQASPSPPRAIAIVGEALIDVFPEQEVIGGAPFNVARNLAALGCASSVLTRIGEDDRGDRIVGEFERFDLDTQGLQIDADRPTGSVTVHKHGAQHHFEIASHQAWDALEQQAVVQAVQRLQPAIIYFGTLAQRESISRGAVQAALHASTAIRFLDLNLRDGPDNQALAAQSLASAHIVKVNDTELEQLLTWFLPARPGDTVFGSATHRADVHTLMRRFDITRLVVTRGADGYAAFELAGGLTHQGVAPTVRVRDTVGAGDAFAAVLILGELHAWSLPTTLERASAFASMVCGFEGAVTTDLAAYDRWSQAWSTDRTDLAWNPQ